MYPSSVTPIYQITARANYQRTVVCLSRGLLQTFIMWLLACCLGNIVFAQDKNRMVRLAKLVIDADQVERYKAILKEEVEASVRLEPGVLTLYAVWEKEKPTHFTILEIYADSAAYKAHVQTPHFLKYKNGTKNMVKSLELVETTPLVPSMKIK